jgi:translation initiation factor IF-3
MPPFEALKIARERGLDLVEVSPTAQPPVCRIMDFGKYLYQQEKREREAKKHQHTITVKEVKFRINVDEHDYQTKKNHVLRFLGEGDKVKATIFFRGREMTHTNLGRKILDRLVSDIGDKGIVEFRPRMEGNTLHAILAPPKAK